MERRQPGLLLCLLHLPAALGSPDPLLSRVPRCPLPPRAWDPVVRGCISGLAGYAAASSCSKQLWWLPPKVAVDQQMKPQGLFIAGWPRGLEQGPQPGESQRLLIREQPREMDGVRLRASGRVVLAQALLTPSPPRLTHANPSLWGPPEELGGSSARQPHLAPSSSRC